MFPLYSVKRDVNEWEKTYIAEDMVEEIVEASIGEGRGRVMRP